jgi:GNAT superfamily N-acetyltransferase
VTIVYRHAERPDREFIVSTWSSTYKASHFSGPVYTDRYASVMHEAFGNVLDRPEATALIACERDDPDFFYGHIVGEVQRGEAPIVHYVFVKAPYRQTGIARGLFAALGVDPNSYFVFTCNNGTAIDMVKDRKIRGRFDPNGIRYSKANRRRAL